MICDKCGHQIPDDANFCSNCGNQTKEEQPAESCEKVEKSLNQECPTSSSSDDVTENKPEQQDCDNTEAEQEHASVKDESPTLSSEKQPKDNPVYNPIQSQASKPKIADTINSLIDKANIGVIAGIAAVIVIILVIITLFGAHIICFHNWQEATCTRPETCSICGKTQGEALGHTYSEATCEKAKTCTRCGSKSGKALGHTVAEWSVTKEASCTEKGTESGICSTCGKEVIQDIDKVDHIEGDWEITSDITVSSSGKVTPGTKVKKCTVCGTELDKDTFTITLTTAQKNAMASAASYLKYMSFSYSGLVDQLEYEGYSYEDATFAVDHCGADWYEQAVKTAASYLKYMSFSKSGLIDQLEYEGFSYDQAVYGVEQNGY